MMKLDQDRNVMGYPSNMNYPQHPPPHPAYSFPHHQGYLASHDNVPPHAFNRPASLANYAGQHHPNPCYPIPTNGYPPTPGNPKGYSNVASFAYYKTQVYQPLEPGQVAQGGSSFVRFMTLLFIVLVAGMCTLTFVIWLLFGTEIPDFHVTSLTVPTFNINETELIAKWEANMTITNLNEKLEICFSKGRSSIFYKNNILALDHIEPLHMGNNTKSFIHPILSTTTTTTTHDIPEELLNELSEDRKNGHIIFSLRIAVGVKFKTNNLWRKEKLKIFCEDLGVAFSNDTGVGTLTGHNPHECLIFT